MKLRINPNNCKELELEFENSRELSTIKFYLSPKLRNHRFQKVQYGKWSGIVEFIRKDRFVPIQLWQYLYTICSKNNIKFDYAELKEHLVRKVDVEFAKSIYNKIVEYDPKLEYDEDQFESIIGLLSHNFVKSNLSVSYGKTAVLFVIVCYSILKLNEPVIIVNPKPSLNVQMYAEFTKWSMAISEMKNRFMMTSTGVPMETFDCFDCLIGNFQYLHDKEDEHFVKFKMSIVDEVHRASSKSYKKILAKCINLRTTKGVSGTILQDHTVETLSILVASGFTLKTVKKREIIDSGRATDGKITVVTINTLSHTQIRNLSDFYIDNKDGLLRQKQEIAMIRTSEIKIDKICRIAYDGLKKHNGNGLIFFRDVKNNYGRRIFSKLCYDYPEVHIFYIDEKVKQKDRDEIYEYARNNKNVLIVVSYDIASTGLSIENLAFGVMGEAVKSATTLGQVIGRFMRKHSEKGAFCLYDIIDDIKLRNGELGYSWKWYKYSRKAVYDADKFEIEHIKMEINHEVW